VLARWPARAPVVAGSVPTYTKAGGNDESGSSLDGHASSRGTRSRPRTSRSARPGGREQRRQLRAIYRLSRIRTRRSVLQEAPGAGSGGPDLLSPGDRRTRDRHVRAHARYEAEARAGRRAGGRAGGCRRSPRDHAPRHRLCTGSSPRIRRPADRRLGLPAATSRTHLGYGCHALYALRVAKASRTRPAPCVLVWPSSCARCIPVRLSPDLVVANALFGDGRPVVAGGDREVEELGVDRGFVALLDDRRRR